MNYMKNVKTVVVKMPTGQNFLIETYDKKELMELLKKIEEVLKMTDEIMNGYLDSESAEKMVFDFFEFADVINDYSDFEYNVDYDLENIFER